MALRAGVIVGAVIAHVLISPLLIFGWGPLPALGPAGAGWGLIVPFGVTFDGLFLGRLGADVLAGASLAFPFVMLIQHTAASGMGGAVSSAISRALGASKREVADALALHTFALALGHTCPHSARERAFSLASLFWSRVAWWKSFLATNPGLRLLSMSNTERPPGRRTSINREVPAPRVLGSA
jgi:Na+-driven multidrug efflux pump